MYVITGATGNTGKIVASSLLEAGKKVRIICRHADKAKDLTNKGAELCIGDASNTEFLKSAFKGAKAVYAIIANDMNTNDFTGDQERQAKAMADALSECKVSYVVALSSQGAHLESGSGVVLGLHKMETLFNKVEGLNTLFLRATYFMENSLGMIGMIKQAGIMGSPVKPDLSFPVIATKDIGAYAAKRLLALDFTGHNIQNLLGAREVTYNEMTKVYGSAIGKKELKYVETSYADFKKGFQQMGATEHVADKFCEFIKALNEGKITALAKRDKESTTHTTIEEFAHTFNYVYNM